MPVAPPTNTLVDQEAAWFAGDATLAALVNPSAYSRKRADGAKGLDLRVVRTLSRRISNRQREITYVMEARLTWPLVSGSSSMTNDQRYLEAAVEAFLNRLMGPTGDHTHGGLWLSVGESETANDEGGEDVSVTYSDPIAALDLPAPVLEARITYRATKQSITN